MADSDDRIAKGEYGTSVEHIITDKEGRQYHLFIDSDDGRFELMLWHDSPRFRVLVGRALCPFQPPDTLILGDIIIYDDPCVFPKGIGKLIPYCLWKRLAGMDYRQRGLGTVLLQTVIAQARTMGATCIKGFVTNEGVMDNPKLLNWYQKHGFQVTLAPSPGTAKTDRVAWIRMDLP